MLEDIWLARTCGHILAGFVYCFLLEEASLVQVFLVTEKIPKMNNDEYCTREATGVYSHAKSHCTWSQTLKNNCFMKI